MTATGDRHRIWAPRSTHRERIIRLSYTLTETPCILPVTDIREWEGWIFYSRWNPDNTWDIPVNLGYPLNTSGNEATLHVSADGSTAYYSSDREDSYGGLDLYHFVMPGDHSPQAGHLGQSICEERKDKRPLPPMCSCLTWKRTL